MTSLILSTATRYLLPLLLLFSVFLLVRGHNQPGGGFVAGLVAAAALSLYAIAHGAGAARRLMRADPRLVTGLGLIASGGSGVVGLLMGDPFMTGRWWSVPLPGGTHVDVGTPLLFDVGVYLVVVGAVLTVILTLSEE